MMNNLTINCKEINRCLDETNEPEIETTCSNAVACYDFMIWKNGQSCQKKGCFEKSFEVLFNCKKVDLNLKNNSKNGYEGYCCNNYDFCNATIEKQKPNLVTIFTISGLIIFFFISITLVSLFILMRKKKAKNKRNRRNIDRDKKNNLDKNMNSSTLKHITSGGSGAGFPLLIERTLTKEIQLETQIGRGKFGNVWRGNYQNRKVAVKIFNHSTDYDAWKRETEIYDHYSLANEFILKYLGSDITSSEFCTTEFWIVLDYHELGSLYDYLQKNSLSKEQVLSIMYSTISGLVHLHDLYEFTTSKPSIAHRDLKSKNLLMKTDRTVCIADFGLSITSKGIETNKYDNLIIRSGTKRYMPPEVLDESIDQKSFKAFQMADIYSFALLLWEIIAHSELNCHLTNYKPPYYEYIGEDPSFEDMKRVVSTEQKRPSLDFLNLNEVKVYLDEVELNRINKDQQLIIGICDLIEHCWLEDSSKRYDYIAIRKRFTQILDQNRSITDSSKESDNFTCK